MQKSLWRIGRCLSLWLGTFVSLSCGGSAPGANPASRPQLGSDNSPEAAPASLRDAGWERLRLDAALLELELPEARGWHLRVSRVWARLEHAATGSVLEVQGTRAGRLVRPADCEARARLDKPELPPLPDANEALDRRTLSAPPGFLTEISVSVSEASSGELQGHVLGFGAKVGRCLALHFTTNARGPGREAEIARRLGLIVERVLPSLSEVSVEARVRPEPFER